MDASIRGLHHVTATVNDAQQDLEFSTGLRIELIGADRDERQPWVAPDLDTATAIRGVHSVSLMIAIPEPSLALLVDVLGYSVAAVEGPRTRLSVGAGGPGCALDIVEAPEAPAASNGLGTVHHVAMAVATADEQLAYRQRLGRAGVPGTQGLDRQDFPPTLFR